MYSHFAEKRVQSVEFVFLGECVFLESAHVEGFAAGGGDRQNRNNKRGGEDHGFPSVHGLRKHHFRRPTSGVWFFKNIFVSVPGRRDDAGAHLLTAWSLNGHWPQRSNRTEVVPIPIIAPLPARIATPETSLVQKLDAYTKYYNITKIHL